MPPIPEMTRDSWLPSPDSGSAPLEWCAAEFRGSEHLPRDPPKDRLLVPLSPGELSVDECRDIHSSTQAIRALEMPAVHGLRVAREASCLLGIGGPEALDYDKGLWQHLSCAEDPS